MLINVADRRDDGSDEDDDDHNDNDNDKDHGRATGILRKDTRYTRRMGGAALHSSRYVN